MEKKLILKKWREWERERNLAQNQDWERMDSKEIQLRKGGNWEEVKDFSFLIDLHIITKPSYFFSFWY